MIKGGKIRKSLLASLLTQEFKAVLKLLLREEFHYKVYARANLPSFFREEFSVEIYNNTQQFTLQKSTQKPILFTVYKR